MVRLPVRVVNGGFVVSEEDGFLIRAPVFVLGKKSTGEEAVVRTQLDRVAAIGFGGSQVGLLAFTDVEAAEEFIASAPAFNNAQPVPIQTLEELASFLEYRDTCGDTHVIFDRKNLSTPPKNVMEIKSVIHTLRTDIRYYNRD